MAGTIFGGDGARDGAGEKSQADDHPTRDPDASQTTTDHTAPTRILLDRQELDRQELDRHQS
jgi:hypothetical protein